MIAFCNNFLFVSSLLLSKRSRLLQAALHLFTTLYRSDRLLLRGGAAAHNNNNNNDGDSVAGGGIDAAVDQHRFLLIYDNLANKEWVSEPAGSRPSLW